MMNDVAIFWDYENCQAPSTTSGYALVQSIRSMAQTYGSVKTLKAYVGITEQFTVPRTQSLRSELQCSGVSLIDCPHNGRKDVADKMMIGKSSNFKLESRVDQIVETSPRLVDMLAHAIDNPSPSTIVLISGDRDFAYALSILRLRCYRIILCTTSHAHLSLVAQASECIDWANLCAAAANVIAPQWTIPNQPATPKTPIFRLNSQREVPASVPAFKASQEFKEQGDAPPPVHERKRSTFSFASTSSAPSTFGNPKSVTEFVPSYSKQTTSVFKWPTTGGSPNKSLTNLDYPKFQSGQTLDTTRKNSGVNETIMEGSDMNTVASTSTGTSQNVAGSSSESSFTYIDNDVDSNDDLQDPIPIANDADGYSTRNEARGLQHNTQTPKTPSAITFPDFTLSSNHPGFFTSHLASPFGISNSNQGYIPSPDSSKLVFSGTTKPPPPTTKFNYSAGVPAHFVILIKVLQAQLREGKERVLRSQVGEQISHKGVTYQKAGANSFSDYVAMAQRAGIVELGGSDGKAWIALTSDCRTIYVA